MTVTAGLDVGGAHLKVALVKDGTTIAAQQFACPLWKGLPHLDHALDLAAVLTKQATAIAVTMTGELSDIFANREQGVSSLIDKLEIRFPDHVHYWCGSQGFHQGDTARTMPADVASMNFLATAEFVASKRDNALLIDMGSTTTDIIPIVTHAAAPRGLTDADRLNTGELVYTGLTRTSLIGLAERVPFKGRWQGVMHEHFATMADVYRILGTLPDGVDLHETADGHGKSVSESINRLARMLGVDGCDGTPQVWQHVTNYYAEQQLRRIHDAIMQVISNGQMQHPVMVVAAGTGYKLIQQCVERLGFMAVDFASDANAPETICDAVNHSAPAVAVAQLLWAKSHATTAT
ncbi:MAG: hydantoinase/oxoprolinase family protein [Hyphomicrobiaceae bacterium]